jgi:nucleotide-binding universal stress UspA family protein
MNEEPKILAFTDGSAHAEAVYLHAAWAARRLGAKVDLLHMLDHHRESPAAWNLSGAIGMDATDEVTRELVQMEAQRGKLLLKLGQKVVEDGLRWMRELGVENSEAHARHGRLVDEIEAAGEEPIMIVLGKRGTHEGGARDHLGSNLQRGIKSARAPVLVADRSFRPIRKFLFAYDGGPSVLKAMDFLATSALFKGCVCHFLRTGHLDDKARWYAAEAAEKLRQAGYEVETTMVEGRADAMIKKAALDAGADLVVMGAYGHSPIRHLMMGSTTTFVLLSLDLPVLLFR